jgi:gamma-glutamylcyclotransferase (GGCT)/AIG2-like uncharacterized protein YtfP
MDEYSMLTSPSSRIAHPHIEFISGPIFLTAPHGLKLAGPRRKHLREKHTTEIVLLLSKAIGKITGRPASFCVWNYKTARKSDPKNKDPNYLYASEWPQSSFSTALLKFKAKFRDRGIPCFHLDFHGKNDRKKAKTNNIDVGIMPFEEHPEAVAWSLEEVLKLRTVAATSIDRALDGLVVHGKKCVANPEPRLHGWWGDDSGDEECETTMTHQAVLRGIPSLQLETPRSVRNTLRSKGGNEWIDKLAQAVVDMYQCATVIERQHGVSAHEGETKMPQMATPTTQTHSIGWDEVDASAAIDIGTSFFVYGSLRPDDITGMPWRDAWLKGAGSCVRGEILGQMFDDSYASVVLGGAGTVQGWVVEFPTNLYKTKLTDGDSIEGYPDMYGRTKTTVLCHDGSIRLAWVYNRPDCAKHTKVPNGDWLAYQEEKRMDGGNKAKSKKTAAQKQLEEVEAFVASNFKEYRGQHDAFADELGIDRMIDRMVHDCTILDKFCPDRQV